MNINPTAVPTSKRITGTLHKRGYVNPASLRNENLPRKKAEESEVTGRHENNGQMPPFFPWKE